jgi:hypothetical protein
MYFLYTLLDLFHILWCCLYLDLWNMNKYNTIQYNTMIFIIVITTIRHNTQKYTSHQIAHHAETKHSTQSCTNNKGHITHNEYNEKKIKATYYIP